MKIQRYCTCGAVLKVEAPRAKQSQVLAVWYSTHSGPGHLATDASGAEQTRMGFGQAMGREASRERR